MEYWIERALKAQKELSEKSIKATERQMRKYYRRAAEKTVGRFEKTYNKIFSRMSEGKQPTPADLYKLDTYWQMEGQLKRELQKLGDRQIALLSKKFEELYFDVYYSFGVPGKLTFNTIDTSMVQQLINQIWVADGTSWSQRIWNNTDKLQQALNDNLMNSLITGMKSGDLKKKLMDDFNVSYHRADALIRTEVAHIQTMAAKQRYEDYGIRQVEVWADEDERRCEVCGKLHQKRYYINETMPVPAHPRCRCAIIPVVE